MSGPTGYRLSIDGLAQALQVVRFEGHEAISELFEIRVTLSCDDEALAFSQAVGRPAVLTASTERDVRHFHGIVSRFEQGEEGEPLTTYHVTLVPLVYRLLLRRTSRVFEQMSVPDVVRRVLQLAGIPAALTRFVLHGSYAVREHVLQHRESDWAFVSRLLADEGIFYFFDQREDGCVLVIADTPLSHPAITGEAIVPFRGSQGALSGGEHVTAFRYSEQLRPGRVSMRGYSYQHPRLPLASDLRGPGDEALELHEHEDFDEPKSALSHIQQKARVTLEAWQSAGRAADGASTCVRFAAGSKFTLSEHPRDAFNGPYLITRITHLASRAGVDYSYSNKITCIPADVPFRPLPLTKKPVVHGVQTAVVVGPAGEEIHTDALGRVKIHFHWDREGHGDGQSSCWVRVSQAWAGGAMGSVLIPRVGHEVVVDFIDGDLDRPIVIGSVYHGVNLPPVTLPGDRTASTLKSSSVPGGKGSNELRVEDAAGAEEIFVHAQRDLTVDVEHDEQRTVGHDETLLVENDRDKTVQGNEREKIGIDKDIEIGGSRSEQIGAQEWVQVGGNSSKTVAANQSETTGQSRTLTVGANHTEVIGQSLAIMVGASKSEAVTHDSVETVGQDKRSSIDGTYRISVGGPMITGAESSEEHIDTDKTVRVGTRFEITSGKSRVIIEEGGKIIVEGPDVEIRSSGPVKVAGKKLQVKATGPVQIKAAGRIDLKGRRVEVN